VEDRKSVHENVIYTKGVCQMPFTDLGPPKTGWEVGGLNELQPAVIRKRNAVKPYNTLFVEDSAAEIAAEKAGLVKDGWDGYDPHTSMAAVKNALGLLALETMVNKSRKQHNTNPDATLGAIVEAHTLVDHDVAALVREPTDLSMPEEDVIIAGATGVNEVMNGVYFKLSQTFGVKAFKMVKMHGAGAVSKGHPIVRFLYKDAATGAWTISPRPMAGISVAPGCAFSHDEFAEHPSMVSSEWYVWHPHTQALQTKASAIKEQAKEAEKAKTLWESIAASLDGLYPVPDFVVCRSMVGFEMTASADKLGHVSRGLMLRIPQTLYGRPVYEAESGGQFLYFLKDEGDLADGMTGWEDFQPGAHPDPNKLFKMSGNWVLSREIALPVDEALGYCKDLAVTPDLLESQWKLRQLDGTWAAVPDLKLRRQEWTHQSILEAETPSTVAGEEKPLLSDIPSK